MKEIHYDEYFDLFVKIHKLKEENYKLLKENERLKESEKLKLNKLYGQFVEDNIEMHNLLTDIVKNYKNRIEKAIKFIEENKTEVELNEYLLCDCLYDEKTIELIDILKGSDKE